MASESSVGVRGSVGAVQRGGRSRDVPLSQEPSVSHVAWIQAPVLCRRTTGHTRFLNMQPMFDMRMKYVLFLQDRTSSFQHGTPVRGILCQSAWRCGLAGTGIYSVMEKWLLSVSHL